jgi:hypothetical protein
MTSNEDGAGGGRSVRQFGSASRVALAAAALALSTSSMALPVTFDFNSTSLLVNNPNNSSNGLGAKIGSSAAISTYMSGVLGSTVTVSGAIATPTYNGENHVVGETLGTSDGGVHHGATNPPDVFIINNNFGIGASASDQFSITFANFKVITLTFDWEIFPDNTCSKTTSCGSSYHPANADWPDIELFVNNSGTATWKALASYTTGQDPQAIGTIAAAFDFTSIGGATKLTFVDWPAEIGIDNFTVTGSCVSCPVPNQTVPEPPILPLVGLALTAMYGVTRRAATRGSSAKAPVGC